MGVFNAIIDVLDKVGVIVGLVTAFFSVFAWINTRKLLKKRRIRSTTAVDERDVALVIQMSSGTVIEANVVNYLLKHKVLSDICNGKPLENAASFANLSDDDVDGFKVACEGIKPKARIITVTKSDIDPKTADKYMLGLHDTLKSLIAALNNHNVRTVHLFYTGPAEMPAFLGCKIGNQMNVVLYRFDRSTGTYFSLGALRP